MDSKKTCKRCLEYKPNNKKYFRYKLSEDKNSGRLSSICLECLRLEQAQKSMSRVVKRTARLNVDTEQLFSYNGDDAIYC